MSRHASTIHALMSNEPAFINLESVDLDKRLERCFIVLEGLQVCADEAGVYDSGSGKNQAVLSPELKGKALKWAHAADDLSQGEEDLRRTETTDSVSWESMAISMESDSIIMKIIEGIAAAIRAVFKFIHGMLFGFEAKASRVNNEYKKEEVDWDKEWDNMWEQAERKRRENAQNNEHSYHHSSSSSHSQSSHAGGYRGTGPAVSVRSSALRSLSEPDKPVTYIAELLPLVEKVNYFLQSVDAFYRDATSNIFNELLSATEKAAESPDRSKQYLTDITLLLKKSLSEFASKTGVRGFTPEGKASENHHSEVYPGGYSVGMYTMYSYATTNPNRSLGAVTFSFQPKSVSDSSGMIRLGVDKESAKRLLTAGGKVARSYSTITELSGPIKKLEERTNATIDSIKESASGLAVGDTEKAELKEGLRPVVKHISENLKFISRVLAYADVCAKDVLEIAKKCKEAA